MDISLALTTASQTLNLVKDLRDLNQNLQNAEVKIKMADLYNALADVKIALSDAKSALHEKDEEICALNLTIETLTSGEACPLCQEGRMRVTASKPHPQFAFAGVQEQTLSCQNSECRHSEKHLHDPRNVTGTQG